MEIPCKRHVLGSSTAVWLREPQRGCHVVMVEELALWTVLITVKRPLILFEGWKLEDHLWWKCDSRHLIKPSRSGDCV